MSRTRTSEPRCKQLNLSLTERELASIEARAAALGMRPVHFSRALLLEVHGALSRFARSSRNRSAAISTVSSMPNSCASEITSIR